MTNISWLQFAAQLFKLLKSIKFEANPWNGFTGSTCQILRLCIHITCMYPAWKCKTKSISLRNKQWSTFPGGRKIHLSHDHDIPHHVINFFWIHEGKQSISWYMQLPFWKSHFNRCLGLNYYHIICLQFMFTIKKKNNWNGGIFLHISHWCLLLAEQLSWCRRLYTPYNYSDHLREPFW